MRATQFLEFINREKMPGVEEQLAEFTHISITEELKETRRKHRLALRKNDRR